MSIETDPIVAVWDKFPVLAPEVSQLLLMVRHQRAQFGVVPPIVYPAQRVLVAQATAGFSRCCRPRSTYSLRLTPRVL